MGDARQPQKTKLFAAIMFRPEADLDNILKTLSRDYGPVDDAYGPIAFNFSNYYEEEMGGGLLKTYISFSRPFDREVLPHIKKTTNDLESAYSINGKRAINVDPGYIAKDKLVACVHQGFLPSFIFRKRYLRRSDAALQKRQIPIFFLDVS